MSFKPALSKVGHPKIVIDTVSALSDNISSSVLVTPIVTYDAENSFAFDTSATESFSFSFKRVTPENPINTSTDPEKWDNAKWMCELIKYVNCWQAKTDGITFQYEGSSDVIPFFPAIKCRAYIKSISFTRPKGYSDMISGTVSLQTGSMLNRNRLNSIVVKPDPQGPSIPANKQYIQISSSDGSAYYTLYFVPESGEFNCVSSYEMKGGPLEPFPSVTMVIAKKRLANLAPDMVDDIKAGRNRLIINAIGHADMIVTKCKTTGNDFKITAYGIEEAYKGLQLGEDIECGPDAPFTTPYETIQYILDKTYDVGDTASLRFPDGRIKFCYKQENNTWSGAVTFPETDKVWYVLSVCAMRMGCTIWFQDGYVYVVDTSLSPIEGTSETNMNKGEDKDNEYDHQSYGKTYLNVAPYSPEKDTPEWAFACSVLGTPSLEDTGTDALCNMAQISIRDPDNQYRSLRVTTSKTQRLIKASIEEYGERTSNTISIPELNRDDAQAIADLYPLGLCDTQQTISFKLSEATSSKPSNTEDEKPDGWKAYYRPFSQLSRVIDHNSDTLLTNLTNFKLDSATLMRNKLMINSYVRQFPEMTTTYTVGKMSQTDLTQTVSTVLRAIDNSI